MKQKRAHASPTLQRGTGKPHFLYRQLADRIRDDIVGGRLASGQMLPSMDHLAAEFDVNKATVRQAIADLAAAGLVNIEPARGTFVANPQDAPQKRNRRAVAVGWISTITDHGRTGRYHTELLDAVRSTIQQLGGHLLVFNSEGVPDQKFLRLVRDAHLDGALLVGPAQYDPLRHLVGTGLPAVLVDNRVRGQRVDCIMVDNEGGGFQAVDHLIRLGHRRLALVTGPGDWQIVEDRLAGARAAMRDSGQPMSEPLIIESDFTSTGGHEAALRILQADPRPTGAFFFNDEMAAGALRAIRDTSDVRVPRDLSVVGFDDILWASLSHPALTTIHVDTRFMGYEAVLHLQKMMQDPSNPPTTTFVPPQLVVRGSTGPAPLRGQV